jgi:hypothetical protein
MLTEHREKLRKSELGLGNVHGHGVCMDVCMDVGMACAWPCACPWVCAWADRDWWFWAHGLEKMNSK